jgi:hypothetical protein
MLYGRYYDRKLQEGMIAAKAKVALMRKLLRPGSPLSKK